MDKKIFAGIVLYNPDVALLKQELDTLNELKLSVVIVDNNSLQKEKLVTLLNCYNNVLEICWNETNKGIAKAHNQILTFCIKHGAEWVITFDQDSVIPNNMLYEYSLYAEDGIGIISPMINYLNGNKRIKKNLSKYIEKEWVIASASMINVKAWQTVNGFDEKMFIDLVDRDFCFRIRRAGYKIVALTNVLLNHNLGNPLSKKILFHSFNITNHNAIRKYYKVRNYIYICKKNEVGIWDAASHIARILLEVFLLENDKCSKVSAIFHGILDGLKMTPQK